MHQSGWDVDSKEALHMLGLGGYEKSVCLPLNFAVNVKLL